MRIEIPLLARLRSTLSADGKARPGGPGLSPGSLAEVLVEADLERDRVLLKIGSQELTAKNTAGLKIGQRLLVQIQPGRAGSGEMILQVLGPAPEASSVDTRLRSALAARTPLAPVLKELAEVLKELPARPGSGLDRAAGEARTTLARSLVRPDKALEASLKNLSSRLGLDFEARLAKAAGKSGRSTGFPGQEAGKTRLAGGESGQAGPLGGELKPALLGLARELARELAPTLNQTDSKAGQMPGLGVLKAELAEALALLKSAQGGGIPGQGAGASGQEAGTAEQPGPEPAGPGRERPSPAGVLPLKAVLRLPRGAEPLPPRSTSGRATPKAPDQGLNRNLARLKGAFIKRAIQVLEQAKAPRSDRTAGTGPGALRLETARAVKAAWPRLAQSLSGPEPDPQALANQLETALRGAALRLGTALQAQTQAALTGIEEAVRGLEAVQVLNALAVETETSIVLPLPLAQAWGAESGQILFYKPPHKPGGDDDEKPLRLVFLLDMTRLGKVRVDVSMIKKSLMINLYLAKAEAVGRVSGRLGRLEKSLVAMGYNVRSLKARPVRSAPPLEEVAPQPASSHAKGFIDIKA